MDLAKSFSRTQLWGIAVVGPVNPFSRWICCFSLGCIGSNLWSLP